MASVTTNGFIYDVFLSFRGEDTRYGFTGYLHKALLERGIRTFFDDEDLRKGEEITPSLVKAIEDSRIAIVVLSKNYASSSFCLQELSTILGSVKGKGRSVWPVFYKVDPSDVRKLKRSYRMRSEDNLHKWKNALHQVANLSGFHYREGDGYEHEFIGKIVEQISREIKPVTLPVAGFLVGLEFHEQNVKSLLDVGSNGEVHMVGIHGIGGIGKTTLALAVFNSIADHFEGSSCFLENVRENSEMHGLLYLQNILLSEIIGEKKIELTSVKQGMSIIQQRLRQKKVLLLIDDVDKEEHLDVIAGSPDWFGLGSRIIITTRDKRLLTCHRVERTYEMKGLNKNDAFELLRQKALKTDKVSPSYADILNRVVTYASGLPLALEVIGSHLFNKTIDQCNSALDRYERVPDKKIQAILKMSYDALEEEEKSVFLDICCCFKGLQLAVVENLLYAHHGDNKRDHINVLVEKSLIKISEIGNVTLHDLVEDMGKEIVRQESPKDPGKRSRLWFPEDIVQVLEEDMGTGKIEIIYLDSPVEVKWNGEAFKKMKNLKTLIIKGDQLLDSPKYLPNSLRILLLQTFSPLDLPADFYPKNLAMCTLPFDFTSLGWQDFFKKKFEKMRVLDFESYSGLTQIPDISGLLNLEKFSIQNCENLVTIDDSVGLLRKLKFFSISASEKLNSFPSLKLPLLEGLKISYCDSIESFAAIVDGLLDKLKIFSVRSCCNIKSIQPLKLTLLEELDISYCQNLESFPPIVDGLLENLKILRVTRCSKIRSIPPLKLTSLEELNLSYCDSLENFPLVVDGLLCKLKFLSVRYCCKLRSIPPLKLDSLQQLDLSHCDSLESFPPVVDELLEKLQIMRVVSCNNIRSIPPLKLASLEELNLSYCSSLESFPLVVDGLLGNLKFLVIRYCCKLRSFPLPIFLSLDQLEFSFCESLESFPPAIERVLVNVKILRVISCRNIKSIPLDLVSIEELNLSLCDNLESFSMVVNGVVEKLKFLSVRDCPKIKSIPLLKLASLEELHLSNCDSLESLEPVVDLLMEKLKFLSVKGCHKLKSFPVFKLPSLEQLNLSYCDSLESFPPVVDGLLEKLKILRVTYCRNIRSIPPLKLASLEQFDLSYCDSLECFPPVVDGLLEKLKILRVIGCRNIKSFPPLHLNSLEELNISCCDSLENFPPMVNGWPGKLQILCVTYCHKLKSIPPLKLASLKHLDISYCDSLECSPPL